MVEKQVGEVVAGRSLYSSSSVVWDSKGLPLLPGASVSCSPSDMLATL